MLIETDNRLRSENAQLRRENERLKRDLEHAKNKLLNAETKILRALKEMRQGFALGEQENLFGGSPGDGELAISLFGE